MPVCVLEPLLPRSAGFEDFWSKFNNLPVSKVKISLNLRLSVANFVNLRNNNLRVSKSSEHLPELNLESLG